MHCNTLYLSIKANLNVITIYGGVLFISLIFLYKMFLFELELILISHCLKYYSQLDICLSLHCVWSLDFEYLNLSARII